MIRSIYLVGAGNMGREIESWLGIQSGSKNHVKIKGYLNEFPDSLDDYPSDYKILGNQFEFDFDTDDYVIVCQSDPVQKEKTVRMLQDMVNFMHYIAPNVLLGKYYTLGKGVIIGPNTILTTNVRLGDFVFINCASQIGHDCSIGNFCSLMPHVNLGGHVTLGNRVYIGTGATVIPNITIVDDVKIGAGAVVIKNISKPGTYFGNPAKPLGIF